MKSGIWWCYSFYLTANWFAMQDLIRTYKETSKTTRFLIWSTHLEITHIAINIPHCSICPTLSNMPLHCQKCRWAKYIWLMTESFSLFLKITCPKLSCASKIIGCIYLAANILSHHLLVGCFALANSLQNNYFTVLIQYCDYFHWTKCQINSYFVKLMPQNLEIIAKQLPNNCKTISKQL